MSDIVILTFDVDKAWWLSSNMRPHWAEKARRTKTLRTLGWAKAREQKIGALGTSHVAAFIGYPTAGRADPANAQPTIKALIDGLVDAGVWPDDDHTHVIGPTFLRDPKSSTGGYTVRLLITAQDVPW